MTTFVHGVLESSTPGSDCHVRWLSVRTARGGLLSTIFDYQGISIGLIVGRTYELALELTYPFAHGPATGECWQGVVVDVEWPRLPNGVSRIERDPEGKQKKPRPIKGQSMKRHRPPLGPTCVLIQVPFGHLLTSVSQLRHHLADPPRKGGTFTCPQQQRLDLLAILS